MEKQIKMCLSKFIGSSDLCINYISTCNVPIKVEDYFLSIVLLVDPNLSECNN